MTKYVLALDTSGESVELALGEMRADGTGADVVREVSHQAHRATNSTLLIRITELLAQAAVDKRDLVALVVGCTLGSYTGVRIGVATAKGLAQGLGIPLYGVATAGELPYGRRLIEAFEQQYPVADGDVGAVLPFYTRLSNAEEAEVAAGKTIDPELSSLSRPVRASQSVTYRRLTPLDLDEVAALEAATETFTWSREQLADELSQPGRFWVGAFTRAAGDANGRFKLVAFAAAADQAGELEILQVATHTAQRRQHIARTLLEFLLEIAADAGIDTALLELRASNTAALALYQSLGFAEVGRRRDYYPDTHEDAILFTRRSGESLDEVRSLARPLILGIESSCDETAAAVVADTDLLSNVVASQIEFHARFGGVVPEIASRKHTEAIVATVDTALREAATSIIATTTTTAPTRLPLAALDGIAVTDRPGLIGALVVGLAFAKGLAWATDKPLYGINHLEGHLFANILKSAEHRVSPWTKSEVSPDAGHGDRGRDRGVNSTDSPPLATPFVALIVSGGHTSLVYSPCPHEYRTLGETLDDATGEAFDKVAKALDLGYPGGPILGQLAATGNPAAINFPRAMLKSGDYAFSLSGLKTAVITYIHNARAAGTDLNLPDLAASFQQAIIDVQVAKALRAIQETGARHFLLAGGVAANTALREALTTAMTEAQVTVSVPPLTYCGDNAAMIARTATARLKAGLAGKDALPPNAEAAAGAPLDTE